MQASSTSPIRLRRVLVTGATGFIGKHLVRALLERGEQVRGLGRNERACEQLAGLGCEVAKCDLRDRDAVIRACEGTDVVIHAGALSSPWGRTADFFAANVSGTENVLLGCRTHSVSRLVYLSSPSVISSQTNLQEAREDIPYPKKPISTYSWTKRLAEEAVRRAAGERFDTVILRPKAVFGPGDTSLVPRLLRAASVGRLRQVGDGLNRVDLTYVDNVVDAVLLAIDSSAASNRIYHITNDEHVPIWEVIRHLCRAVGYNHQFGKLPYPVAWAAAAGMEWRAKLLGGEPLLTRYTVTILAKHQTYDISAAKHDLGYVPRVSIAEAIERTLQSL